MENKFLISFLAILIAVFVLFSSEVKEILGIQKEYEYVYGDTIYFIPTENEDTIYHLVEILDSVEVNVEWGPTDFKLWNE